MATTATKKAAKPAARKPATKKKPTSKPASRARADQTPVKSPSSKTAPLEVKGIEKITVDDSCINVEIKGRFDREAAISLAKRVQRATAELY